VIELAKQKSITSTTTLGDISITTGASIILSPILSGITTLFSIGVFIDPFGDLVFTIHFTASDILDFMVIPILVTRIAMVTEDITATYLIVVMPNLLILEGLADTLTPITPLGEDILIISVELVSQGGTVIVG
tara:strand:- start:149 stop:547 length:399 start_codon:yes stop_codon:yes gene_type:complete